MSVSLYNTGVSALNAAQQQLSTTGHNIANVNTEGYSRQRAEQQGQVGVYNGDNFIGGGTYISDIARVFDQFAYKEQLVNASKLGNANGLYANLDQLNDIMSYSGNSVMGSIENFYQSINAIADNPSDAGLRSIALSQSSILASDFNSLSQNFDQLEKFTNSEIDQIAGQISEISVELAKINEQILSNQSFDNSGSPNDLLDKRDQLLNELSQYTNVTTVEDANGVQTVLIGSGSTLVAGITPMSVSVQAGDPDPAQTTLTLDSVNSSVSLNPLSMGGALGAKFEFRDVHLKQTRSEIDRLAMAISETLNDAQAQGIDLNQQQGANIFTDINSVQLMQGRVLDLNDNTGTLTSEVEVTDISLIPTDEFLVEWDGANYQMTNLSDGSITTLTAQGGGVFSSTYGFNFNETGGAPGVGDSFVVRPSENSAALMTAQISDPDAIAASTPVTIEADADNLDAGSMVVTEVYDPVLARAAMPMELNFQENPPGVFTFTVTDNLGVVSAPQPYNGVSQTIDLPLAPATAAFQITVEGALAGAPPNAFETFSLTDGFGNGNGGNALKMALTQEAGVINGGQETFTQNLGISTSTVGSKASSAELVVNTAEALHTQAYNRNQATSGVNLDEEAANLIKFQQAYQAASQIISTANTIFDTLLSAAR